MNEHDKEKLLKLLRNAYIELCRAKKILQGIDNKGGKEKDG